MPNQDKETVRRVLEALLEKLDGEPRDGEDRAILLSEGSDSTSPVIVLLGGLNSGAQDAVAHRQRKVDELGRPATANLSARAHDNPQASHPGLERFPLAETQSHPAAPKACFMEPGRTCVSSGACEMRGY
jgi:hypothetical protein